MHALLLLLAGCSGGDDPSTDDTATTSGCRGDPVITVNSPDAEGTYAVGERLSFDATATSSVGEAVAILWAVDGDVEVVGGVGGWTPSAAGDYELTVQAEDSCGLAQKVFTVHVRGGDTGAGDTGAGDTGDTGGDTGGPPAEPSVATFGAELGIPLAAWRGLSIGPDGVVWAASESGLVRFDPATEAVRVYGTADGLYPDAPTAVLAASDGTVWAGHTGDTTRQGEQLALNDDGSLTVLRAVDYTESEEIQAVRRLREQPYGAGAGDVWMGTNEVLCLYDADLGRFAEHAHPTHPHSFSDGVAITADGDIWNGDAYQLSRWRYSNDGDLSPSADLAETVPTWPVAVEEPIGIADLDADGADVWVASELFGVAHVAVNAELGASTVALFADPPSASAVRADGEGNVWIGGADGLWRWDGATLTPVAADWIPADGIQEIAVDSSIQPPAVWYATSRGLVRVVGAPG